MALVMLLSNRCHNPKHIAEPLAHELDDSQHFLIKGELDRNRPKIPPQRLGIKKLLDSGIDECFFISERTKDCTFGDSCGFCDLFRGKVRPKFYEQRHRGLDNLRLPVFQRERTCPSTNMSGHMGRSHEENTN